MITGAAGFLGSSLVDHFRTKGSDVYACVRPGTTPAWETIGARECALDLLDPDATRMLIHAARPDVVFHLAANSSVARSTLEPAKTIFENVQMQHHVLDAVRTSGNPVRVVVMGSSDEYAPVQPPGFPIAEEHPLGPKSPYGRSKLLQDLSAAQLAEFHALSVMRARPFLTMGPRRSDVFVAGAIARQVAEIRLNRMHAVVHVGNQTARRDFTDVRDVACALAAIGQHGISGDVYNIASGVSHQLRELVDIMMQHAGVAVPVQSREELVRPGESDDIVGDATLLRATLGWTPKISFEQSACDTVDYWINRLRRGHG